MHVDEEIDSAAIEIGPVTKETELVRIEIDLGNEETNLTVKKVIWRVKKLVW